MPDDRHAEYALRGSLGAHSKWAHCSDRSAATAPARQAALDKFEREVDPGGVLPEPERAQRAEHARKLYFKRLALRSAQSRRKAKEARESAARLQVEADEAETELQDSGGDAA